MVVRLIRKITSFLYLNQPGGSLYQQLFAVRAAFLPRRLTITEDAAGGKE
jgi:hypothetical protein